MDPQTALRIAELTVLSQIPYLPLEEIQTRIVSMCLQGLEQPHRRDHINLLPLLTDEEARALCRELISNYVAEHGAEPDELHSLRRAA